MMKTINRNAIRASFNTNQMAKMATSMPTISAVVGIQECEECNRIGGGINARTSLHEFRAHRTRNHHRRIARPVLRQCVERNETAGERERNRLTRREVTGELRRGKEREVVGR